MFCTCLKKAPQQAFLSSQSSGCWLWVCASGNWSYGTRVLFSWFILIDTICIEYGLSLLSHTLIIFGPSLLLLIMFAGSSGNGPVRIQWKWLGNFSHVYFRLGALFVEPVSDCFKTGSTPPGTSGPWMSSPQANARRTRKEKATKRAILAIFILHTAFEWVYTDVEIFMTFRAAKSVGI